MSAVRYISVPSTRAAQPFAKARPRKHCPCVLSIHFPSTVRPGTSVQARLAGLIHSTRRLSLPPELVHRGVGPSFLKDHA